jgi:hypothetical protein
MRGDEHETAEREAAAECSSSRTLGEYAVSARLGIRSTASLPQKVLKKRRSASRRAPLFLFHFLTASH